MVPFTKTAPQGKPTAPRPRYHIEETGTDRIQSPARNTTTALHPRRLHPIPQQHRPSPPAPDKGGHHYRSRTSGRRSLPLGPATLRNTTDLPTGDAPAATTNTPSLEAALDCLMTMLKRMITVLIGAKPAVTPPKASRPTTQCWKCGRQEHLRSACPQTQQLHSCKPRRRPRTHEYTG